MLPSSLFNSLPPRPCYDVPRPRRDSMADRPDTIAPSFMRALCMGSIEEDLIFPYPELRAEERDTLKEVLGSIEPLLGPRAADFRKWDHEGEMPASFVEELKQFGLFGLVIPEDHGGLG